MTGTGLGYYTWYERWRTVGRRVFGIFPTGSKLAFAISFR